MEDSVVLETREECYRIVLKRPERHNSLGATELESLHRALDLVSADVKARALVITGAGDKTFCAGAFLGDLEAGIISGDDFQAMTDRVAALALPTVAVLNGNLFGGGVELALSCDFRIAAQGIRMRVPAAAIGLCYPLNGIRRFVEKLGVNAAKRLLVGAEELNAGQMRDIGFLSRVVARQDLAQAEAEQLAGLAGLAPLAVRSMNELIDGFASGNADKATALALVERCLQSNDLREGLAAAREKRPARFTGA